MGVKRDSELKLPMTCIWSLLSRISKSVFVICDSSTFNAFTETLKEGGSVKYIVAPHKDGFDYTRKYLSELESAAKIYGAHGLAWMKVENGTISAAVDEEDSSVTANVNLYSTGSVITVGTGIADPNVNVNSAYYVDGDRVYTSVSNAAAYTAENGLMTPVYAEGTFSETGDIVLDDVDLQIQGADSVVTLGNVELANSAKITATGGAIYSATVTGLSGEGDAAVDSTVSVVRSNIGISSGSVLNASGVNEYTLTIDGIDGSVTISAGTVVLDTDSVEIDREHSLTVDNGATLIISYDGTTSLEVVSEGDLNNNNYLVNNGTIHVHNDLNIDSDVVLSGDVIVDEDGQIIVDTREVPIEGEDSDTVPNILSISGTLTVSAEENNEGAVTVSGGAIYVGEAPELLGVSATGSIVGKIDLTGAGYVIVFSGASVDDASIMVGNESAVTTSYEINSIDFATVYGAVSAIPYNEIDSVVMDLENLEFTQDVDGEPTEVAPTWNFEEQKITSGFVGDYNLLSTEVEYAGVDITVSQGPGLSIYIDDVYVGNAIGGIVNLPIGEHTITVYVDAGYEGTPVITLNGETITGGSFTITSDMLGEKNILYATGATPSSSGPIVIPGGDSGDSGMGLTDYLLIILVVLIVVMAIIVALRLMRS